MRTLIAAAVLVLAACKPEGSVDPTIETAGDRGAWAVHETLEARIEAGTASEADRAAALEQVRAAKDDGTAAHAYARASVAGRVAEGRGLQALALLEEMDEWARRSIERDPEFEGMAAQRLLGTLHVLAGGHLRKGDSEYGLELLESVVDAHPEAGRNHLRVAEAYIALGDEGSSYAPLCKAIHRRGDLRAEEAALLDRLIDDVGGGSTFRCEPEEP